MLTTADNCEKQVSGVVKQKRNGESDGTEADMTQWRRADRSRTYGDAVGIFSTDFLALGASLLERMLLFVLPLHFRFVQK